MLIVISAAKALLGTDLILREDGGVRASTSCWTSLTLVLKTYLAESGLQRLRRLQGVRYEG